MKILKIQLHWQILIALVLSIIYGIFFKDQIHYVAWLGEVFLRALKMIIIPLILSSIVSGVTNLGSAENLGRLGAKTILYYLSTSTLAIITGLFLVNIIQPGSGADLNFTQKVEELPGSETLGQTLIHVIPDNIFSVFSDNTKMLSVIFFAILFGFFITQARGKSKALLTDFFNGVFDVMMKITLFIIKFTPLGIFGLVAEKVAQQENLIALLQSMGLYMGVVLSALAIHAIITLPLIIRLIGRSNPWKHFSSMKTPLLTAWSTSSSSATLPLTMEAVENKSGVSNKISSFTLPLGATINMDGTALYECVAVMFIGQAYGYDITIMDQVIIVITALLASIGAAGIPMAGLVMITIILTAIGWDLESVGLILAVDRILDMFRTATNVWSDSCGAVVIAKSEGESLKVE
ncbi:MAG: dicarboxylate/amino acid:cation symporter [Bacteroidales bacterium]|nr:dicarboxylate/amino acid:cation symporter [Bacteroidales bacterium]